MVLMQVFCELFPEWKAKAVEAQARLQAGVCVCVMVVATAVGSPLMSRHPGWMGGGVGWAHWIQPTHRDVGCAMGGQMAGPENFQF